MLSEAKHLGLAQTLAPQRQEGHQTAVNQYHVYILTNKSGTLYTGVTSDLRRRVYQHKGKLVPGFTSKYNLTRLVFYEAVADARAAIEREKQIKGWLRRKKIALIESVNPTWEDLAAHWFADGDPSLRSG